MATSNKTPPDMEVGFRGGFVVSPAPRDTVATICPLGRCSRERKRAMSTTATPKADLARCRRRAARTNVLQLTGYCGCTPASNATALRLFGHLVPQRAPDVSAPRDDQTCECDDRVGRSVARGRGCCPQARTDHKSASQPQRACGRQHPITCERVRSMPNGMGP